MNLLSLDEFIQSAKERVSANAYVNEPGWNHLYVRYGRRVIDGEYRDPVLDIANLEAEEPGKGTFKALIARIRKQYPECTIYIENVHPEQFKDGLRRMGFVERPDGYGIASSFYMARVEV